MMGDLVFNVWVPPLTLSLSPWVWGQAAPLPWGEGQGEGR